MDWLFEIDNKICDLRVAGILIQNNKIVVQRDKNGSEYAIPGGHVKIGETTEEALIREYKEETGADVKCERLLWTEECFWEWKESTQYLLLLFDSFV
ncbi:MAG: NUDIX domain-containing protein [Lachnospiraceae bacterium]|nr:NUDIX domain-containing protein [Lachnospiraceae bacterium]